MRFLGLFAASVLAFPAYTQATWYVDDDGVPPGSGTQAAPYSSIQYAVSRPTTADGDRILVAAGLYLERVDFGAKRLNLESVDGPLATEIRAPSAGAVVRSAIFTAGAWLQVTGFTISGSPQLSTIGVSATQMVLRRCIVR